LCCTGIFILSVIYIVVNYEVVNDMGIGTESNGNLTKKVLNEDELDA